MVLGACQPLPAPSTSSPLPTPSPPATRAEVAAAQAPAPRPAPPVPGPIVTMTPRCALYRGGAIRCWSPSPGVDALRDAIDLSGDDRQTWAIRRDGTVHCHGCSDSSLEAMRQLEPLEHVAHRGERTIVATRAGVVHMRRRDAPVQRVPGLPSAPTRLAVADDLGCAFYDDGPAWCWGDNEHGQIPGAQKDYGIDPVSLEHAPQARSISGGLWHLCLVDGAGAVRCSGSSTYDGGELGDGTYHHEAEVTVALGEPAVEVAAGWTSTCAVLTSGSLRCWGQSDEMFDTAEAAAGPFDTGLKDVEHVAMGRERACAGMRDGSVTCLGNLVGDGMTPVAGIDDATAVAVGDDTSCAIREGGELWCWGAWEGAAVHRPRQVHGIDDAVVLSMGKTPGRSFDGCVVRRGGQVVCWDGDERIEPGVDDAVHVAVVHHHACAARRRGQVSCWGTSGDGALGAVDGAARAVEVDGMKGAVRVAVTGSTSCAIDDQAALWCWGDNGYGLLANGRLGGSSRRPVPTRVSGAAAADGDFSHMCALGTDGRARCWGFNSTGEVLFTSTQVVPRPIAYPGVEGAESLAVGNNQSCIVGDGDRLVCWGHRFGRADEVFGERRGRGPKRLTVPGIAQVAIGYDHACLRKHDGTLLCWGDDAHGERGSGAGRYGARRVLEAP